MSRNRAKNNYNASLPEGSGHQNKGKEPQLASHNSLSQASVRRSSLSPAPAAPLPPSRVNKNKNKGIETNTTKPVRTNIPKLRGRNQTPTDLPVSNKPNITTTSQVGQKSAPSIEKRNHGNVRKMGDNMSGVTINPADVKTHTSEDQQDKLSLVLAELKDIKQEIKQQGSKLDSIDNKTAALADQLSGVIGRTAKLETAVATNVTGLREVNDQLHTLKAAVDKQERAISSLANLKGDINEASTKTLTKMNELVDTQGEQVAAFKSTTKVIKLDIMSEVNKQIQKIKEENYCQSFKTQAFNSRKNLIVIGLSEEENSSPLDQVRNFFVQTLKVQDVHIKSAYRIGDKPNADSGYARPISVKFKNVAERNRVWRNRMDITNDNPEQSKIRVLADLPKPLREGIQALYKVANAASKMEGYQSAKVREYQLELNEETYQFTELENLPLEIRPSTLAAPRSDFALAFFSKHSFFSNHFLSDMEIEGRSFSCMEHYLAFQRAILSEKQSIIKRARQARDPLQAKHILHLLKEDHPEEWDSWVEEVTLEGLRAKFTQNITLKTYLCDTGNLQIGEASENPRWGIGMNLSDEHVLDYTKWKSDGNLLGKCLMKIREEMRAVQSSETAET